MAPATIRTPNETDTRPELLDVLARLDARLQTFATSRIAGRSAPGLAPIFADARVGSRTVLPAIIADVMSSADASEEDSDVVLTSQWLLRSPADVMATFGRPTEIGLGDNGEYWTYAVKHPKTGEDLWMQFTISPSGYVVRVDC